MGAWYAAACRSSPLISASAWSSGLSYAVSTWLSGGPALTDTLGRLERWDSDVLSVRKADGTLVQIPLADVVAGKPIPAATR